MGVVRPDLDEVLETRGLMFSWQHSPLWLPRRSEELKFISSRFKDEDAHLSFHNITWQR